MRPYYVGTMKTATAMKTQTIAQGFDLAMSIAPNPFSSYTNLQLVLKIPSTVIIHVYDAKGTLVQRVFEGQQPAGIAHFSVNGKQLASGVYWCEILVNNKRTTRKIVVQK